MQAAEGPAQPLLSGDGTTVCVLSVQVGQYLSQVLDVGADLEGMDGPQHLANALEVQAAIIDVEDLLGSQEHPIRCQLLEQGRDGPFFVRMRFDLRPCEVA